MCPVNWDHADTPVLRVMSNKIGKSFTGLQSSSLTGASCCSESRTTEAAILADRDVYQSRLTPIEKSRTLSLERCTS